MEEQEALKFRAKLPPDLLNVVFSWSLDDICDKTLFRDKVAKIPQTFKSVDHYFGSFFFPLMEEIHEDFCSKMETISNAPFSEVLAICETKSYKEIFYNIRVHTWNNETNSGGKEDYRPAPGDVLVLSNLKPESASDLNRYGKTYALASIIRVEDDGESLTDFKVKTSNSIEIDDGMEKSWFAVFLFNLTTYNRVWKALGAGCPVIAGNLNIIKEVLRSNNLSRGSCNLCNCDHVNDAYSLSPTELNGSQMLAVVDSLAEVQCNHQCTVKLIWGPPGTGKTKTISELLWRLVLLNRKVLTCTPTNVSVVELSSRLLKLVQENRNRGLVGETSCYSLGDIILFGNIHRLKIPQHSDLFEIFLDHRVERLAECFAPLTGWKHRVSAMIDFLESCVSQYHLHLENEKCKDNKVERIDRESEGNGEDKGPTTFLEFFRNRFHALALPLRSCARDLCTHLPRSFFENNKYENLIALINMLGYFERLLSLIEDNGKYLEELLVPAGEVTGASILSMGDLEQLPNASNMPVLLPCQTRKKCLDMLLLLRDSIHTPNFFDKGRITDFCLTSAAVVFCTAATSFKLVGVGDFDVLVIDEASQLKECESVIPLRLGGIQHAILIGDECQLPATVKSMVSENAGFGRSLFERLSSLGHPRHLLKVQYRMHPSISLFPNNRFYSGLIEDASSVTCKTYEKCHLREKMYGPYSFINVTDGREEFDEMSHSRKNLVEVAVVLNIVKKLFRARSRIQGMLRIGIISPYAAQVSSIQGKLGKNYHIDDEFIVKVNSIDGFQGGEEDVVIISTVRSNCNGSIGFLSCCQRANVALTRARHCLWIVGNSATLIKSGSVWEALIRNAEDRNCFFNADEDETLSKAIVNAKKELGQIDDLLNMNSVFFRNARWRVLFSDNFKKSFSQIKSTTRKKAVINLLLRLAEGWRPRNYTCSCDDTNESPLQLVKQYKVDGLYVICATDLMKSECTQVLKIWDILPLAEVATLLKRLESIFATYTDDYVVRCKVKCIEGKLEIPAVWSKGLDIIQYKNFNKIYPSDGSEEAPSGNRNYAENSKVAESLLLMKFYSLSSGAVKHLLSGQDGREIDLPFEVTDQEREIISFPRSSFILGRSGTGKTTILTMKLIQREQLHYLSSEGFYDSETCLSLPHYKRNKAEDDTGSHDGGVLQQLFVTVSPKLCSAIKSHICRLNRFACGDEPLASDSSADMCEIGDSISEFADIPDGFSHIHPKHFPLVITFQKFLMMLDGSVGSSFFKRFQDLRELQLDERGFWRFPVFHAFFRQKEVNYDRFASAYWPHFNDQLTRKLDSSTVFKEIISHIKGGLAETMACDRILSKDDYVRLSGSRASNLNTESREAIFDIFIDYEKKKVLNGEFDLSDLVIDIHRRLRATGGRYVGDKVDFIYVDEVQDLTMRQIALFKYVSRNFVEGFVFAGDTAQTIARGIDFRFQDIRSLFYTEFLSAVDGNNTNSAKYKDSSAPDFFHLSQNFRTHAGILKLAQSVVDLVYAFFPQSVDRLVPENSLIYGEAPIVLESNDENAIVTIFGNCGGKDNDTYGGFGAEQVILVRDSASKAEISTQLGKQALVLTIIECKGLEFQDVLLYNFFGSSPLKNKWRVIYSHMKSHNLLDDSTSVPIFKINRYNILCSELKQLYVAITRTRQRLWICETREEYSKPMLDYWKKLCLVQTRQLDESLAQAMRVTSSKDEWRDQGVKLFREGNFEMATMCFERAGDVFREKWARAAGLRASGNRILHSSSEMARAALTEAAEIYKGIGKAETAAECYIELKEFKKAGFIYMEKCDESRLEDAGDCFSQAGCLSLAAEVYGRGDNVSKCLSTCLKGNLFDMGLTFIKKWKGVDPSHVLAVCNERVDEINSFLEKSALYYHRLNDKQSMMRFVRGFTSMELMRSFLMSHDCLEETIYIMDELGNFKEAAEIARLKGDLLLEAKMLEKAGLYGESSKVILFHIVKNSLWAFGNKGWPLQSFSGREMLLEEAKSLAEKASGDFSHGVFIETRVLADTGKSLPDLVNYLTQARTMENFRAEFFALWKILDVHLQSDPSKFVWDTESDFQTMKREGNVMFPVTLSLSSLLYFWNLWKQKVEVVLETLQSLETDAMDASGCRGFCLEYFGARKQNFQKYVILNSEASWIRETDCRYFHKIRDLIYLEARQFDTSTRRYWNSKLFHVGIKLLQSLEILHKFSAGKSFSLFFQGKLLIHIFEVSEFLLEFEPASTKHHYYKELKKFSSLAKEYFFQILFPLDSRSAMMENMTSLIENGSAMQLRKQILSEIVCVGSDKLTYGKIGRVVMLILGIKNPDEEIYATVNKFLEPNRMWTEFIEQLQQSKHMGFQRDSLAFSLQIALRSTFDANWVEVDYISPHCFLYLAELLLFFASSCKGFYFSTRSSFISGMNCLSWEAISGTCLVSRAGAGHSLDMCFDSVVCMAYQLLIHKADTGRWIRNSGIREVSYHKLLVLRLVIMIGLAYLNCGRHFDTLFNLLKQANIVSELPPQFFKCLKVARRGNFDVVFASALVLIEDPLVIVGLKDGSSSAARLSDHAINMEVRKGREQMLNLLFPKSSENVDQTVIIRSSENVQNSVCPGSASGQTNDTNTTDLSLVDKVTSAAVGTESEHPLSQKYSKFWSTLEFCQSEYTKWKEVGCNKGPADHCIKAGLHDCMQELKHIFSSLNQVNCKAVEDFLAESQVMFEELNLLSSVFDMREEERAEKRPIIDKLLVGMSGRRQRMQDSWYTIYNADNKAAAKGAAAGWTLNVGDGNNKPTQSKHQKKKKKKKNQGKGKNAK